MEISLISDPISSIVSAGQSIGFSNLLLKRSHNVLSLSDASSDQSQPLFQVSAASRPPTTTLTRPRLRASRRVRRKTSSVDDGDENNYSNSLFGFTGGDFSSFGDGYFGNGGGSGGGGGGGGGWNGGYGGSSWEESADNTVSDPAFDFVYMILCCIALSNCLLFSLKKAVVRVVGDRDKVDLTVC